MKQLYEVGECVILQSEDYPQYNGEYTVFEIILRGSAARCRISGVDQQAISSFVYALDQPLRSDKTGREVFFLQSALRKKHEPSQQSFKDLMTTLKSPQKVEWD